MGDFWFPKKIKPLTNKVYNTSRGSNIISSPVAGGLAAQALRYTREPVPFTLNFNMSDSQYQGFLQFYDVVINHGANSFKMNLDSGNGIVEHQVFMAPNTLKASKPSHNNWYVGFTAIAEVTPSQGEVCDNLYQLWDCYGEQSCELLNSLEDFATGIPFND